MVMKLANRSSEIQYVARTINPRRFSQKEKQSSRQRDRHGDQPADRQLLNRFQLFFKKKKRKTADKQPGRRVLLHASVFLFLLRSKIGEIEERPRRLHQMQNADSSSSWRRRQTNQKRVRRVWTLYISQALPCSSSCCLGDARRAAAINLHFFDDEYG